ncbi:hypothetical protein, partial [Halomonas sp. NO4]|uniref:hypothetical protein n=1 Tax=Halomonas sp. NO4 TaxID=2484813 RepID=UPI001969C7F6
EKIGLFQVARFRISGLVGDHLEVLLELEQKPWRRSNRVRFLQLSVMSGGISRGLNMNTHDEMKSAPGQWPGALGLCARHGA